MWLGKYPIKSEKGIDWLGMWEICGLWNDVFACTVKLRRFCEPAVGMCVWCRRPTRIQILSSAPSPRKWKVSLSPTHLTRSLVFGMWLITLSLLRYWNMHFSISVILYVRGEEQHNRFWLFSFPGNVFPALLSDRAIIHSLCWRIWLWPQNKCSHVVPRWVTAVTKQIL